MEPEEPWGLRDDDNKYQPLTEDITDDEGNLYEQQDMESSYMKELPNGVETLGGRKRGTYRCDRCEFATGDFMSFITHKNAHTQREKHAASFFTCGMCEFVTPNPQQMTEHIQSHMIKGNRENILTTAEKKAVKRKELEVIESIAQSIVSDIDPEPPLLITEVKSAAPQSPIYRKVDVKPVNSVKYDLAPPQDIEVMAHSTIEVSNISPKQSKVIYGSNAEKRSKETNTESAADVEEKQAASPNLPPVEIVEDSLEAPLKWVELTEAVPKPSSESLNLSFSPKESSCSAAEESLIGYLELRRIKPSDPMIQQEDIPKKVEASVSEVKVSPAKIFSEKNGHREAAKNTSYKAPKPVAVKFFANKNLVVATDKGVKVFKETSSKGKKQVVSKKGETNQVKLSASNSQPCNPSALVRKQNEATRFTRRSQKASENAAMTSPKKPKLTENTETKLVIAEKVSSDMVPEPRVTRNTKVETSSSLELSAVADEAPSKASEEDSSVVSFSRSDVLSDSSSQCFSRSEEQLSSVSLSTHKKPKKDLLLRYQNEISRESANTTPTSIEHESSKEFSNSNATESEDTEKQVSSTFLASGESSKPNEVIDLVVPTCRNLAIFPRATSVTVGLNVPAVKELLPKEAEKGNFCKIVLSRCSVIDEMGSATPNFALKLQSSLRDCWKKMQINSACKTKQGKKPEQSDSLTLQDPKPPKRKLMEIENGTSKKEKNYKCEFCDYSTGNKDELFIHSNAKHAEEEKMYLCDNCDYITSRLSKLTSHAKVHSKATGPNVETSDKQSSQLDKTISSSNADKAQDSLPTNFGTQTVKQTHSPAASRRSLSLQNSPTMRKRSRISNNWQSFPCTLCSYQGSTPYSLENHLKTHNKTSKQYRCKHCKFSASKWGNYIDHQYTHKSNSELSCYHEKCGFKTSNPQVLTSHRLLHKVIPQYSCDQCNYTTFRKDLLEKHSIKSHSADPKTTQHHLRYSTNSTFKEEQPFKCAICWYSARNSKTLAKHMRIHATKKRAKFRCDACKFGTNHKLLLEKHIRNSKKCKSLISCID